jgi:hypothetical protein
VASETSSVRAKEAVGEEPFGPHAMDRTMIELAASREIVGDLIGRTGLPQLLIRVGRAALHAALPVTPRRPVSEVLEFQS